MRHLGALKAWALESRNFPDAPASHACGACFKEEQREFEEELANERRELLPAIDQETPKRIEITTLRIIRDTALAREIKALHQWRCQLCQTVIRFHDGSFYAEAHHLRPLGGHHQGHDVSGNIVCVCPTCHAMLDYGVRRLDLEDFRPASGHQVSDGSIQYHNQHVYREPLL